MRTDAVLVGVIGILLFLAMSYTMFFDKKEPEITLTQKQFMILYKEGYLNGKINELIYGDSSKKIRTKIWVDDSTSIANQLSKFFE